MNGIVLTLIGLVTSIALVAGLVWASRRLLGLPVRTLRALMAGLLGFAAAEAFGRSPSFTGPDSRRALGRCHSHVRASSPSIHRA